MATATAEARAAARPPRRGVARRLVEAVTTGPARIFLLVVGLLWLIPSFGLLASSFRPVAAQETGWWQVFTRPAELTVGNYVELLRAARTTGDFLVVAGLAIVAAVVTVAATRATMATGWVRIAGWAVIGGLSAYLIYAFFTVGGLAALIVVLVAVPILVAAARAAFEGGSRGRLAVTVLLVLALEIMALIPAGSGILFALRNSVLITVPSAILLVLIAAGAAYAFAWVRFPGRDIVFLLVVALLVVPLQIGLIPIADLYGRVGLFGTIPGVVLFHVGFGLPFAVFLLRNFFIGIPHELLEAARMDGASEWRVFSRVVLPLGIPAIASLLIFQFLWVWNDLLVALVFAGSDAAPLTVAIQQQLRTFGANIDIIAPGAFIQMLFPLIVFFSFQRYFVQGLLAGSQK